MKLNKISILICALLAIILMPGCKSPKKVGTVASVGSKQQTEFFDHMKDQALDYRTLSARMSVELNLPGKEFSSRVDLKMIKDSAIQLSVQPLLGIEILRIELTKDSVKMVDRINKRYVADNYEKMRSETPVAFNFYNLQALFTNRVFVPGEQDILLKEYSRFLLDQSGSQAIATIKDNLDITYTFKADGDEKLLQTQITAPDEQHRLQWSYADFRKFDGQVFPTEMNVGVITDGSSKGGIKMSFSRVQINENIKMDFTFPPKFKRVGFSDIIKSLTKEK